ncbi:MAG: LamG-like jellyroll fold domain-containing protein [Pedobacter sp.]|uniref:LamG-like jellyroll fold domain-containing protein n=1 Tax=Pedobacter sp. TaxID=1411316 RepID=UPI00280784D7|nr:LamG-like jellyroll fold domain-containing protein [Pedobacter sp.]MDQ8003606.1 LamG-like jellyroll fold domain-containing protein [Pedobacter sp.]
MATSLLLNRWFLTLCLLFSGLTLCAQTIGNYAFTAESSQFTLNGVGTGVTTLFSSGSGLDDQTYFIEPVNFEFWYMGQRYTSFTVSSNGFVALGNVSVSSLPANNLASSPTARPPIIAPLWDDLAIYEGELLGGYGSMSYKLENIAGTGRVLTIQWYRAKWDKTSTSGTGGFLDPVVSNFVLSFQVKLYENTGNIMFNYGQNNTSASSAVGSTASASVGITTDGANPNIRYLSLNNLSAAATASSSVVNNGINVRPANNQAYVFNPIETTAPTGLTFASVGTTGTTLNWADNSTDELGFAVYRATSAAGPFTYLGRTEPDVTTYQVTNLTANTTYFYRVHAIRENLSAAAQGSQSTLSNCNTFNILQVPTTNIVANYRLNGNASDFYNINNGTLQGSPTTTADRFGVAGAAYNFNGTSQYISTANSYASPNVFTIATWFRTTNAQGKLISFGSQTTGESTSHDRHLYIGTDGRVYFGVFPGAVRTLASPTSLIDGQWHHAAATLSPSGMVLYIDGVQVAIDNSVTTGESYTGRWRIGFDRVVAWTNSPASGYFSGAMDDIFIFHRALSSTEIGALYSSPYGVQNGGPVCVGTALQLTAPTVAGAQYSWTGPGGFTSSLQNPTLTYSLDAAGTYSVTVNVGGCTDVARTNVVSSTVAGSWVGGNNTNWANAANWCNGVVPTASINVTIPSGRTNYPTVSTDQAVNNLTIQTGTSLSITNSLSVAGVISNNGTLTVSNGRMVFNGTAAQTIPANLFAGNLIKDLTINNTAGVSLNGALRLTGVLTATSGIFNSNGNLTLASSSSQTAQVAPISSGASVRGKVFVERYMQGGPKNPYRGYRMLSSPVYDNTTEFRNTDVQGNRTAAFSQLIDDVIITGKDGAVNGFDNSHNNGAGAWTYNAGYIPIPNINTSVNAGRGMYFLFRGNRDNLSGKTVSPYVDVENVLLDFEGILNQQDITVGLSTSGFHLLGNPYAATIDWSSANWGADKGSVNNAIWIWNPVARSYATYIDSVGTLNGSRYISSGQGFFVQALAATAIKFKESIKASAAEQPPALLMMAGKKTEDFSKIENRMAYSSRSLLRIGMKPVASFGESEMVVVFDENSSLAFTGEDAAQFEGEVVTISSIADNQRLAINFLPPSARVMEIPISVSANATGNYLMNFNLSEYHQGHTLELKDNYLNRTVPIIAGSVYSFNIDRANALTFGVARFSIVVTPPTVLPVGLLYFSGKKQNEGVLLTWGTPEGIGNKRFKLFRAAQDGIYQFLTNVSSNDVGTYSYIDRSPLPGRNYYKLVQVDFDGLETEAKPITVNFVIGEHRSVVIYPNPVIDNFTIKIDDLEEEVYELNLYDTLGKRVKNIMASKSALLSGLKVNVLGVNSGVFVVRLIELGTGKTVVEEKVLKLH